MSSVLSPHPASAISARQGRPYGRQGELADVCRLGAGVILISGDAGVGKSELLRAVGAQLRDDTTVLCSDESRRLPHRPGALQQTLFEALGDALSQFSERTSLVQRWGDVISRATGHVAQARLRGLVAGGGRLLLGFIRARAGDDVAHLAADFVSAVSEADAERLENRIAAQADSDVLAVFRAIAQEICEVVDQPLVLILDGAERLAEDDFRLLLDLAEEMPVGLHLVITHAAAMREQVDRIQRLDRIEVGPRGETPVRHVPLRPLGAVEIDAWVVAEQIEVEVDALTRVTGGYPLHIEAALAALARGESLSTLSGGRAFVSVMRTNVAALEPRTQELVARLSGHTDRPDEEQLLGLVDMSPEEWAAHERHLVQARIFVTSVGGRPWFHELGRRAIWFEVLSERQRELSARRSLALLTTTEPEVLTLQNRVDAVEFLRADPQVTAMQPDVAEVLTLDGDELSVLAAMIELVEPSSNWLGLDVVARHARRRFGAGADLVPVAHRLSERGLVMLEEGSDYADVAPHWESAAAFYAAVGRMAIELPRVPIGALATRVFDAALRGPLGGFAIAQYGVGALGATELSARLKDAEWFEDEDLVHRVEGPGIMLRTRHGEIGMYAAVSFENEQGRRDALQRLRAGGAGEALGEPLVIELLEPWPSPVLAPYRVASAVELLTGKDYRGRSASHLGLPPPTSVREQLEIYVRAANVVRQLSSPLERDALRLSRPLGVAYALVGDQQLLQADIGGRDTVVELDFQPDLGGAHLFSDLERRLQLGPLESLLTVHLGGRQPKHPLPTLVADTVKRLKNFNAQQPSASLALPLDEAVLSNELQKALDRRTTDAKALVDAGVLPARGPLVRSHYVLLTPDSAYPGRLRRPSGFGYVLTVDDPEQATIVVRRLDGEQTKTFLAAAGAWADVDSYRPWFDLPASVESPAFSQSDAADAVARLLDHETVRLVGGD